MALAEGGAAAPSVQGFSVAGCGLTICSGLHIYLVPSGAPERVAAQSTALDR